ncbi:MAG: T9SS type A sorting domain-containing protein [Candidatus Cloacimonetes bacterium]|nr:T9SS type A sorting domain-containing protein [Candidatus Cloacimonadota bacterium]
MKQIIIILFFLADLSSTLLAQSAWQTTSADGVAFEYRTSADGLSLEGKLNAETSGWVGVGFNPTNVMQGANFIIGYVSNGNPSIRDDWGTSATTHASDLSLGGSSDVTIIEGTEAGGITSLHFTLPLVTEDSFDRPLMPGQSYPIILARGSNGTDNFTGGHAGAGFAEVSILTAPVSNEDNLATQAITQIRGNYPNPFNGVTTIKYFQSKAAPLRISIYNLRGQLVYLQEHANKAAGEAEFTWNANDSISQPSANGIYLVRLESPTGYSTHRISLIR